EQAFYMVRPFLGKVGGVIPIGRVGVHHIIRVEARRPNAQAAFKIVLPVEYHRGDMPPISMVVLVGGPVPRSPCKASGLIGKGIVGLVAESVQGTVADIDPIGITAELGSRGAVL